MGLEKGTLTNTNTEATVSRVTINSTTATALATAKPDRIFLSVCLAPGSSDVDAYIRLYPAIDDNTKRGEVLTRRLSGNDNLFRPSWSPVDGTTIFPGEVSAISESGTFDLLVTEY